MACPYHSMNWAVYNHSSAAHLLLKSCKLTGTRVRCTQRLGQCDGRDKRSGREGGRAGEHTTSLLASHCCTDSVANTSEFKISSFLVAGEEERLNYNGEGVNLPSQKLREFTQGVSTHCHLEKENKKYNGVSDPIVSALLDHCWAMCL